MRVTSFRTRLVAAMLLCAATFGVACESASSSFSSGGFAQPLPPPGPITPGIPPPTSSGRGGLDAPCPGYDPPAVGSDCSAASLNGDDVRCEYGHDLDGNCNDSFECTGGRWQMDLRPSCFGRCPASFADIVPGAPCADSAVGCSYLEGTCACVANPDAADAGSDDAGSEAGAEISGTWRCAPPPGGGCPPQRPSVGSNCVRAMTCDYGACALGRDVVYACDPGTRRWLQADYPDCD